MPGALSHVKSDTIADFTGTFTGFNSQGSTTTIAATDIVRPSDWNSAHNVFLTLSGNTAGSSTMSGTNIVLAGGAGIVLSATTAAGAATVSVVRAPILSSFIPYMPASTGTQSHGAMGTSSASMFLHPIYLHEPVAFNAIRLLLSYSHVSSSVSGRKSLSSSWGLYSLNVSTLSLISSFSLSQEMTNSSGSCTYSFATSTNSAGYTLATSSASASALAQSLFGTFAPRLIDLVFGNTMSLQVGVYWLGLLQRQSSSSANVGLSSARYGNIINTQHTNMQPLGLSAANTTNYSRRIPGFGVYTVTQTSVPAAIPLTQIAHSITNMPLLSFTST